MNKSKWLIFLAGIITGAFAGAYWTLIILI